jgi:hypothetical protein
MLNFICGIICLLNIENLFAYSNRNLCTILIEYVFLASKQMKKIEALLFISVIGLTIWNVQLRQAVHSQAIQPQAKTAPIVDKYSFHRMEVKPVVRKVNDITEAALKKHSLSSFNSVRVIADVVDFQPPPYYDCYLIGNISKKKNSESIVMSFRMEQNFSITRLIVNGNKVPLPEPIYGIPLGESGLLEDIHLVIWPGASNDFSNNGDVGNGYIYKKAVSKGDRIIVVLKREGMFISHRSESVF